MPKVKPLRFTDAELLTVANMIEDHVSNNITGPMLLGLKNKIAIEANRRRDMKQNANNKR